MSARGASLHLPVMPREVERFLACGQVEVLLDATVGAGGHAAGFLSSRGPAARVVGLDRDPEMVALARSRLAAYGDRVRLFAASFADLDEVLDEAGVGRVDAALFDLGGSSVHFDRGERGFSFLSPGPLDMRFDRSGGETAAELIDRLPEGELADLLHDLADERRSRRIAAAIVAERPIRDTLRLAEVVERAVGRSGKAHPATRTFQALRMAVNRELEHIGRGVPAAFGRLGPGGVLVVISFHSGEDRVVKGLFRRLASGERGRLLTRKALRPEPDEVRGNPRARSARLRACERAGEGDR